MSTARFSGLAFMAVLALLLASCDTIAQGYINRLPYSVTIVEHPGPAKNPFTLAPGQIDHPGFGRNPTSFDILARDGHRIAHYRSRELAVSGDQFYRYVVIDQHGAHVETKEQLLEDESSRGH